MSEIISEIEDLFSSTEKTYERAGHRKEVRAIEYFNIIYYSFI